MIPRHRHSLSAFVALCALASCRRDSPQAIADQAKRLGVYAATSSGLSELSSFGIEQHNIRTEAMTFKFSSPISLGPIPTAFIVNMPGVNITESRVFLLPDKWVVWDRRTSRVPAFSIEPSLCGFCDPKPVTSSIEPVSGNIYRVIPSSLQASAEGFLCLWLKMPMGTPDRLYAIELATDGAQAKRTMSDMRSLATAIEAYAVDNKLYPAASCAAGLYTTIGPALRDESLRSLVPTYIQKIHRLDGWGNAMRYSVDAESKNYSIASPGRDGVFSRELRCGTTTDFNDDIVYSNGTFIQWPEGAR